MLQPAVESRVVSPRKRLPSRVWKTHLWLDEGHRDQLEALATRCRKATGYKPSTSELVRACLTAGLASLKGQDLAPLRQVLADLAVSDPEAFGKSAEQAKSALQKS